MKLNWDLRNDPSKVREGILVNWVSFERWVLNNW
jgi:hypothetical protein